MWRIYQFSNKPQPIKCRYLILTQSSYPNEPCIHENVTYLNTIEAQPPILLSSPLRSIVSQLNIPPSRAQHTRFASHRQHATQPTDRISTVRRSITAVFPTWKKRKQPPIVPPRAFQAMAAAVMKSPHPGQQRRGSAVAVDTRRVHTLSIIVVR